MGLRILFLIAFSFQSVDVFARLESKSSDFQEWSACYLDPESRECQNCRQQNASLPESVGPVARDIQKSCLPTGPEKAIAFNDDLSPEQMLQRDLYICDCFRLNRGSQIERDNYASGDASAATKATLIRASEAALSRQFQAELSGRYSTERTQSAFSAMSYVNDNKDALKLSRLYARVNVSAQAVREKAANESSPLNATRAPAEAKTLGAAEKAAADSYAEKANSESISFNATSMPPGICIPYRHFIAHKQFPDSTDFYQGLENLPSFLPGDWNYEGILTTLHEPFNREGHERALEDPRVRSKYERAKFLHGNPVLKNIFLSNDDAVKSRLFDLIKKMPRPDCSTGVCMRNQQWTNAMDAYRREMAGFLAHPDAIAANADGAAEAGRLNYQIAGEDARIRSQNALSVLDPSQLSDASAWKGFCEVRPQLNVSNIRLNTFRRIEEDFSRRDFNNPADDAEFKTLNEELCSESRVDPTNKNPTENFFTFLARECANASQPRCAIESRGVLVGEFLARTRPVNNPSDDAAAKLMLPFLTGRVSGPQTISQSDAVSFNSATNDTVSSSTPFRFTSREYADLSPVPGTSISGAPRSNSLTNSSRAPVPSPNTPASPTQTQSNPNSSSSNQFPTDQVQAFVPSSALSSAAAQILPSPAELRSTLQESESETQEIRDEISSLREVIRKDPSEGGPRDSQAMTSLNQRLASLEKRLQERERENTELREQITSADVASRSVPTRSPAQAPVQNDQRVSGRQTTQVLANGGASSGGQSLGQLNAGGGSGIAGPASGKTVSVSSRSAISSGNAALLSKYNVQSGSVQGALIVANPNSAIDYQALRSQSEGSVLPLVISAEEYSLLTKNDQSALNRYLDQVRAMPGSVVRINITSDGQKLELFALKSGTEISIIPANAQGRSPASQLEKGREFTLDNLRNELGN